MGSKIDVFEIILKDDLKIPLSQTEKEILDRMEIDVKQQVTDLLNSPAFLDEIENTIDSILKKSIDLSTEEQQYIKNRCHERIRSLKYPNLSSKSFDVGSSK